MNKPKRPKHLIVTLHYSDTTDETFYMVEDLNTTEDGILELKRYGKVIGSAMLDNVLRVEVQADG